MKAALYDRMGPARDVLKVTETERPEPGPGEVLVRVLVSAINPTDVKARSGAVPRPIDGFEIPHQDGAGVIVARAAGADLVVNYRESDVVTQRRPFAEYLDRIIEVALGANLETDLALSGPATVLVTYAATGEDPVLPVRACMSANVTLRFVLLYGIPAPAIDEAVHDINVALAVGAVTPSPATVSRWTISRRLTKRWKRA